MKKISILGSTGSIGTQTLDVVRRMGNIEIYSLSGGNNVKLLAEQVREFKPQKVAISNKEKYGELKGLISDTDTEILCGEEGVCEVATGDYDITVSAISGVAGLKPTLTAIGDGHNIAFANKETLVAAGEIVTKSVKEKNVTLLPVDSEHSAVFQCINSGETDKYIKKIILTASGGPFFGMKREELLDITPERALKHPNWSMGRKITIDSATLMNKGLEVIEAAWLFNVDINDIEVVVHRESIIHSMVKFSDNSVLAQLGLPDMRGPISYALCYPHREEVNEDGIDFTKLSGLSFAQPDTKTFKCLDLARKAFKTGGTMPAFMNGANEAAVELFLNNKIGFLDIAGVIEEAMNTHTPVNNYNLSDVMQADADARRRVLSLSGEEIC
jgi:1-deoxy-D-xylulose-5-phosphate reductoisomerase